MSKSIESADELLIRVSDGYAIEQRIGELCRAIEARDKAIRLALLDELIALDDGMELTITVYQAVREMRARYVDKP